jgi:hypothetical protein
VPTVIFPICTIFLPDSDRRRPRTGDTARDFQDSLRGLGGHR